MKKLQIILPVFMVLYVLFMTALVGEAELDGGDDLNHIAVSSWLSWKQIATAFVHPKSPENTLGTGLTAHVLSNRVGQTLAIKILHSLFGSRPFPYYLFQMAQGALCMAFLAWMVFRITASRGMAIFAAFFFALLPSAFLHNIFLSDFAETIHLCTLVSFSCLYHLYLGASAGPVGGSPNRPRPSTSSGLRADWGAPPPPPAEVPIRDIVLGVVCVIGVFYAVKSKPSGWIIPIMLGVASLLFLFRAKRKVFFALCGLIALFSIAFIGNSQLFSPPAGVHLENIPRMLFCNVNNEFESETSVALWNLHSVLPVSLARNVNFFFLWLALFSGAVLIRNGRWRLRDEVLFTLVWFLSEVGFYALTDNAPRYLTDALIPLTVLLCVLFENARVLLKPGGPARVVFSTLFIAGLVFHGVNNFQHLIFLRDWKAGYFNELNRPVQLIYNDRMGRPSGTRNPAGEIAPFAWPALTEEVRRKIAPEFLKESPSSPALPDLLVFSDVLDLYPASYDPQRAGKILEKGYPVYGISYQSRPPVEGFEEMASFRKVPPSPVTDLLVRFKKKKRDERVWVFRKLP